MRPGVLQACEVTGKKVFPSELERCTVTGKRVLRQFLVSSSLSQARILQDVAIRSSTGTFCIPAESELCLWSGRRSHPDDIRIRVSFWARLEWYDVKPNFL